MPELKYLWMTLTSQNCIHIELKSRLISRNAFNHSVPKFLFSFGLSKNINIKIYKIVACCFILDWNFISNNRLKNVKLFLYIIIYLSIMPWGHVGEWRNSWFWHWMEVSGQLHAAAALPPGIEPPVPTGKESGRPQSWPGHCREKKSLAPAGIGPPVPWLFSHHKGRADVVWKTWREETTCKS